MKYLSSLSALLLGGVTAQASLYTSGVVNTVIPDGNPNGIESTITIGDFIGAVTNMAVYLNVSGGYDGDLYAYLAHDGTMATLLNRIGSSSGNPFGSSAAGLGDPTGETYEFSLSDDAATGIHNYNGTGSSYQPDGGTLSSFNGQNANGDWTLFFADMASGGGDSPSTLVSWGPDIEPVPEPGNLSLGLFASCGLIIIAKRAQWRKHCHPAD